MLILIMKNLELFCILHDTTCPLVQLNNNNKNSWFDKDLQKLLQIKETMFKKYCAKKNLLSKVNDNKARNIYFRTLKEKKGSSLFISF